MLNNITEKGGGRVLKFVLGPSGSGKTSWLIQKANKEMKSGKGRIVFIDSDNDQIFSLDHAVRLIDAHNFNIDNLDKFIGFISGIISRDYDVEKVYIDGMYDLIDFQDNIDKLVEGLRFLADNNNVIFYMGMDKADTVFPAADDIQLINLEDAN